MSIGCFSEENTPEKYEYPKIIVFENHTYLDFGKAVLHNPDCEACQRIERYQRNTKGFYTE